MNGGAVVVSTPHLRRNCFFLILSMWPLRWLQVFMKLMFFSLTPFVVATKIVPDEN